MILTLLGAGIVALLVKQQGTDSLARDEPSPTPTVTATAPFRGTDSTPSSPAPAPTGEDAEDATAGKGAEEAPSGEDGDQDVSATGARIGDEDGDGTLPKTGLAQVAVVVLTALAAAAGIGAARSR